MAPAGSERNDLQAEVYALKRERILETAAGLFAERGYAGTSVSAIAEDLGATKPFVYYHFKDKHEILFEVCQRGVIQALAALDEVLAAGGSCRERLARTCVQLTRVTLQNRAYVTVYTSEMDRLSVEARNRLAELRRRFDRNVAELIEEGIEKNEFDVAEPRITATCISTLVIYSYGWFRDGGTLGADEVAAHLAELATRMVGASAGEAGAHSARAKGARSEP